MTNTLETGPAVVLIHGFNGEPADVAYLHDYLTDRGFKVYLLKLRGHAGSRLDMARHGCQSWISGVLDDVRPLSLKHESLYVVGFSMGGLLAVNLLEHFSAQKLVFVNTPIYFWNARQIVANIRGDLKSGNYGNLKYYLSASHNAPVPALLNFVRMLLLTKPKFRNVAVNTLILQNKDDDTVQPRSALYIKKNLNGPNKLLWFETGGHMMFLDERKEDAAKAIHTFLAAGDGF